MNHLHIDPGMLKAVLGSAVTALKELLGRSAATRARWTSAVSKLQEAVLETQTYVASIERGTRISRPKEQRLVTLWRDAANGFYGLDGALASRLQLKAEYWTEPESWTGDQVRDAGIALQHVAEYTKQLLLEGK